MSRLENFMQRKDNRTGSPPPQQHDPTINPELTSRKELAKSLKISMNKNAANSSAATKRLASTAPAPGYHSNSMADRNTFPNNQYRQQQQQQPDGFYEDAGFDDTTVGLDFDLTISDIPVEDHPQRRENYGYGDDQPYRDYQQSQYNRHAPPDLPPHQLHHKRSQSSLINTNPEPPQPYGSRFQSNLQHRPAQEEQPINQQMHGSRKHSRSHQHSHDVPAQQFQGDEEVIDGYDVGQARTMSERGREDLLPPGKFDEESDGADTPTEGPSKVDLNQGQLPDVDVRLLPDYEDDELKGMNYAQLRSQSWEEVPHAPVFELPEKIRGPEVNMAKQIQYYIDIKDFEERNERLFEYFQQMPTADWEQAGAFFVDKFASFMKDIVAIRQERRQLIETFEAEIEAREKAVRGKSEKLEERFKTMKATGQQVLRGKMV
jgi:hypothetical protein